MIEFAKKLEARTRGAPYLDIGDVSDYLLFKKYKRASRIIYDPYTAIPWEKLRIEELSQEERIALRYYWSRAALFEYQLAVILARALEEAAVRTYPREVRQFIMMHLRDEWVHTDMPAEYASRLGGLIPPSEFVENKIKERFALRRDVVSKNLRPFFVQVCFAEQCWAASHLNGQRDVNDPVARKIYEYFYVDELKHAPSNWMWAIKGLSEDEKEIAARMINYHFQNILGWLNMGYLELPREEQEFHIECLKIAKDLGVAKWDAEEYLKRYKEGVDKASQLMEEAGLNFDIRALDEI